MTRLHLAIAMVLAALPRASAASGPTKNLAAMRKLATQCELTAMEKRCLRALEFDDLAGWVTGADSFAGYLDVPKPPGLEHLAGWRFTRPTVKPACGDVITRIKAGEPRSRCLLAHMVADFSNWKAGHPSVASSVVEQLERRWSVWRSDEGYRLARWGMTEREVLRADHDVARRGGHLVAHHGAAGIPGTVSYAFVAGRLGAVTLDLEPPQSQLVRAFRRLQSLLTKKYGEPQSAGPRWASSASRQFLGDGNLAPAVASGQARLVASWKTKGSTIVLKTVGAGLVHHLELRYESRRLAPVMKAHQTKAALKDL